MAMNRIKISLAILLLFVGAGLYVWGLRGIAHAQSGMGGGQSGVGGGVSGVSQSTNCGTTVACAGTVGTPKLVYGSAPLTSGTPSTATLTGLPFTSSTTYKCTATDATTATNNLLSVVNASGASTVITGPATISDTINYICIGN